MYVRSVFFSLALLLCAFGFGERPAVASAAIWPAADGTLAYGRGGDCAPSPARHRDRRANTTVDSVGGGVSRDAGVDECDFEIELEAARPPDCDDPNSGLLIVDALPDGDYVYSVAGQTRTFGTFFQMAVGTYVVTVFPQGRSDCAKQITVEIFEQPNCGNQCDIANRSSSLSRSSCSEFVEFAMLGGPAGATYAWDFGPDATPRFQSGNEVQVTFTGPRRIRPDILVTVTTVDGATCTTTFISRPFGGSQPSGIDVEPLSGDCGGARRFRFSSGAPYADLTWDFDTGGVGDANPATATGPEVVVTYTGAAGPRGVSLLAVDPACSTPPVPVAETVEVTTSRTFAVGAPVITAVTCDDADAGTLTFDVSPSGDYRYVIDGVTQSDPTFSGLSAGPKAYEVYPAGFPDCIQTGTATVPDATGCGPACPTFDVELVTVAPYRGRDDTGTLLAYVSPSGDYEFRVGGLANVTGRFNSVLLAGPGTLTVFPAGRPECAQDFPFVIPPNANCLPDEPSVRLTPVRGCANRFRIVIDRDIPGATYRYDFGPGASPRLASGTDVEVQFDPLTTAIPIPVLTTVTLGSCVETYLFNLFAPLDPNPQTTPDIVATAGAGGCGTRTYEFGTSANAETYAWDFGEGATPRTSTERNPTVVYAGADGPRTVTLVTNAASCVGSASRAVQVTLGTDCGSPCVATWEVTVSGTDCAPVYRFSADEIGADRYVWNFGPAATPSQATGATADVTFAEGTTSATVVLVVTRGTCREVNTETLTDVRPAYPPMVIDLAAGTATCAGQAFDFGARSRAESYAWDFGPGADPRTSNAADGTVAFTGPAGPRRASLTTVRGACVETVTADAAYAPVPGGDFTVEADITPVQCDGTGGVIALTILPAGGYRIFIDGEERFSSLLAGLPAGPREVRVFLRGQEACAQTFTYSVPVATGCPDPCVPTPPGITALPQGDDCATREFLFATDPGADAYNWSFGADASPASATGPSAIVTFAGAGGPREITLAVTRGTCTDVGTATVELLPDGALDFGDVVIARACGTVDIRFEAPATAGYTYEWDFPAGAQILRDAGRTQDVRFGPGAPTRTVSLTVKQGDCATTRDRGVDVDVPPVPNPVIALTPLTTACDAQTFTYAVTGPGDAFTWTFPDEATASAPTARVGTVTFAGAAGPRTASVEVTAGVCTETAERTVQFAPAGDFDVRLAEATAANCGERDGTLAILAEPTGDYTYAIGASSNADGRFGGLPAGPVTVTVSLVDGSCSRDFVAVVPASTTLPAGTAAFSATPVSADCGATTYRFAAAPLAGATYRWDFGPDATPATAEGVTAETVYVGATGPRDVTLGVSLGSCAQALTQSVTIAINPGGPAPDIQVVPGVATCDSRDYVLSTGAAADEYDWQLPPDATIGAATPGTIAVTFNGAAGPRSVGLTVVDGACAASATTVIDYAPTPSFAVSVAGATSPSCADPASGTIAFETSVPGDYVYLAGGITSRDGRFTGLPAGALTVVVFPQGDPDCAVTFSDGVVPAAPELPATAVDFEVARVRGDCGVSTYRFTAPSLPGADFTWDFGTGATPTTADGRVVDVSFAGASGPRPVILAAVLGGCSRDGVQDVDVEIASGGAAPEITASPGEVSCGRQRFAFATPATADAYRWDFGEGAEPRFATEATTEVVFTGEAGSRAVALSVTRGACTAAATTAVTFAPVTGLPDGTAEYALELIAEACRRATYRFTAAEVAGATYAWDFGSDAVPRLASGRVAEVEYAGDARRQPVRLVVTVGDCEQALDRGFTPDIDPEPDFDAALVERTPVDCSGPNSGSVTVGVTVAGDFRYTLGAETNATGRFEGLAAGPFSVDVARAADPGCRTSYSGSIEDAAAIETPALTSAVSGGACGNPRYVFGLEQGARPGADYDWDFGAGAVPATAAGPGPHDVRYPGVNATREVSVAVALGPNCRTEGRTTVTVTSTEAFVASANASPVGCDGGATGAIDASVDASGDFRYRLGDGPEQADGRFGGLPAGDYIVSVRRSDAPEACAERVAVTVDAPAVLTFGTPDITAASCEAVADGALSFPNLPAASSIQLVDVATAPASEFSDLSGGSYRLRLTSADGCSRDTSVVVPSRPGPVVDLGGDRRARLGEVLTITPDVRPGAAPIDSDSVFVVDIATGATGAVSLGTFAVDVTGLPTQTIALIVVDEDGCRARDELTIETSVDRAFEVPTAFSPNDDGLNDRWYLRAGPSVVAARDVSVYDRWGGRLFYRAEVPLNEEAAGWNGRSHGVEVDTGVYTYVLEVEFADGTRRVVSGEVNLLR